MADDIPEFGDRVDGVEYILRPGGYAVVRSSAGKIAVLRTRKGYFLPGGGHEGSESLEQTAIRETSEESGLRVEVTGILGTADELVFAASKNRYYRKRCTFFSASLTGVDGQGEEDHELMWMTLDEAHKRLTHQSQAWAITRIIV